MCSQMLLLMTRIWKRTYSFFKTVFFFLNSEKKPCSPKDVGKLVLYINYSVENLFDYLSFSIKKGVKGSFR